MNTGSKTTRPASPPGGTFRVKIQKPAKTADGWYRILFCFENRIVTGDGIHFTFDTRGAIWKSYSFRNGEFRFGE